MARTPALEIKGLEAWYGESHVLHGVDIVVQPGEVVVYHAWEPHQHRGWKGQQEPVVAPWKAIHLAGGYGQLHYRMFYGSPGHHPRGAPVEVERAWPGSA